METILIGIAGGTGSGKTTLADKLVDSFGRDEVSILRHDNYYKRHDEMDYEARTKLNYDHPDAFDTDLLCEHIRLLKSGQSIDMPVYDYTIHNRSDRTVHVDTAPVIVLEGILIFAEPALRPDGYQSFRRYRCRCPYPAQNRPGRQRERAFLRQRHQPVSDDCQADA